MSSVIMSVMDTHHLNHNVWKVMQKHKNSIAIYMKKRGKHPEMNVDLEVALDKAGFGRYQVFHCLVACATNSAALQELLGYAFVLPAATCDLDIQPATKGLLTSLPAIGIILTAALWGRVADKLGRKPALIYTLTAAGVFGITSAFMPNLYSFIMVKLMAALFMSCPTSLSYAYVAEMMPQDRRDFVLLICNGFLQMSTVLSPLIAWAILSFQWQYQLGIILFRPWRLLTAVYASMMLLSALWLTQANESPKWLMAKGKSQETLDVLRHIYVKNTGLPADSYEVKSLRLYSTDFLEDPKEDESKATLMTILKAPYVKWFFLLGFLMFGVFSLLNGLYMFATDTINKVLNGASQEPGTLCILINEPENDTLTSECTDNISQDTFVIMAGTTFVYAVLVILASLAPVTKKTLLLVMFLVCGAVTLLAGLLTNRVIAGALMSAVQLTGLGIGPITAYVVQIFPTKLRGTAVGGVLMFGRMGAVAGATAAGYLIAVSCPATFYSFAALIFACAALSLVLPKDEKPEK